MAYNKKTWLARLGQGLNKFSIDGATPVPIINQPDSVTQQGDALSAGNLNDLEQRIADAFDDVEESKADKSTTEALQSQINQHESRLENLEQKAGDYTTVQYRGTNAVPTGKAKNGLVEKIVGKSRAWNQLVQNGNFADSSGWVCAYSTINGVSLNTISVKISADNINCRLYHDVEGWIAGHKYLLCATVMTPYTQPVLLGMGSRNEGYIQSGALTANAWNYVAGIAEATEFSATSPTFRIYPYKNTGVFQVDDDYSCKNACAYDLTLIFGAGNEPATVADALAQLPALGQYNAYDDGSLVSTAVSGVKSVGVNTWDEEWENGYFTASGKQASANYIRSKNYIKGFRNIYFNSPVNLDVYGYSSDTIEAGTLIGNGIKNTNVDASLYAFIRFSTATSGTTSYGNNIQLCDNSLPDAIKTVYHPYKTDTLSLPEPVTLKSAGSVAEVLNVESGMVTHPIGSFDLGDYNWTSAGTDASGYYRWEISPSDLTIINWRNAICGRFLIVQEHTAGVEEIVIHGNYKNVIYFTPTQYTSETLKTAMNGVSIICELATPSADTYVDPIIDNFLKVQGGGTVETIQTQTPVIDNYLDVGYLTV